MAFFCKRRGICPSCGTRRMAEAAAHLVDHVIPMVPVRQWVLSFPIPLRSLFAVHPDLLAPILQIIHRAIATLLIEQTGIKRDQAATGAVTLIQRFGSATSDRYTENWRPPARDRTWPAADIRPQKADFLFAVSQFTNTFNQFSNNSTAMDGLYSIRMVFRSHITSQRALQLR